MTSELSGNITCPICRHDSFDGSELNMMQGSPLAPTGAVKMLQLRCKRCTNVLMFKGNETTVVIFNQDAGTAKWHLKDVPGVS